MTLIIYRTIWLSSNIIQPWHCTKPHPTSSNLGIGPKTIQHYTTVALNLILPNIIQPELWASPYPPSYGIILKHYPTLALVHDIQISMISKYPWYPDIHDTQISMISKYPWYPNIHDDQISMLSKYPWYPNIHDIQSQVVTLVTCCHKWSH